MEYLPCTKRIAKRLVCIIESNPKNKTPMVGGIFYHAHCADEKAKAQRDWLTQDHTAYKVRESERKTDCLTSKIVICHQQEGIKFCVIYFFYKLELCHGSPSVNVTLGHRYRWPQEMCRTLGLSRAWVWLVQVLIRRKVENNGLAERELRLIPRKRCLEFGVVVLHMALQLSACLLFSTTSWGPSPVCLLCIPRAISNCVAWWLLDSGNALGT